MDDPLAVGKPLSPAGRTDRATETANLVVEPFRIEDRTPIVAKAVIHALHPTTGVGPFEG